MNVKERGKKRFLSCFMAKCKHLSIGTVEYHENHRYGLTQLARLNHVNFGCKSARTGVVGSP